MPNGLFAFAQHPINGRSTNVERSRDSAAAREVHRRYDSTISR